MNALEKTVAQVASVTCSDVDAFSDDSIHWTFTIMDGEFIACPCFWEESIDSFTTKLREMDWEPKYGLNVVTQEDVNAFQNFISGNVFTADIDASNENAIQVIRIHQFA